MAQFLLCLPAPLIGISVGRSVMRLLLGRRLRVSFVVTWLWVSAIETVLWLATLQWGAALAMGLNLLAAIAVWWWHRRKRKRALKALGSKARAILAAMKAKLRESAKPKPVLKPVPQGAR